MTFGADGWQILQVLWVVVWQGFSLAHPVDA